jgi:anti-anti-sigma factor
VGRRDSIEFEVHSAGLAIVTLRGEHDLGTAPEITTQLTAASDQLEVLVDLSRCTFVDSTVIGALLRMSNAMHARGGMLSLVIPSGKHQAVRGVFELMSIERLLPTYETRAAAITHLTATNTSAPQPRTRLRALSEIIDASLVENEDRRAA